MAPFLIPPSLSPTSSGCAFPDPSQAPLPLLLASPLSSHSPHSPWTNTAGLWPGIHDHLNARDSQFFLLNYVFTGHLPGNMTILANSLAPNRISSTPLFPQTCSSLDKLTIVILPCLSRAPSPLARPIAANSITGLVGAHARNLRAASISSLFTSSPYTVLWIFLTLPLSCLPFSQWSRPGLPLDLPHLLAPPRGSFASNQHKPNSSLGETGVRLDLG